MVLRVRVCFIPNICCNTGVCYNCGVANQPHQCDGNSVATNQSRLDATHDFFVKLGKLLGPLQDLVDHPERYDEQERAETLARYFSNSAALMCNSMCFQRDSRDIPTLFNIQDFRVHSTRFNTI